MAVRKVTKRSEELGQSTDGTYTGKRVYGVVVDDPSDAINLSASDGTTTIPSLGSLWTGTLAKVKSKNATRTQPTAYEVTVNYASGGAQVETTENPLMRLAEFGYSGSLQEEPYFLDASTPDAKPVVNSAGEAFDQQPTRLRPVSTITIARNIAAISETKRRSFLGAINDAQVTLNSQTYAARTLLVTRWDWQGPLEENGYMYWRETIEIGQLERTWDDVFIDVGYSELDSGALVTIKDANDQDVIKPYPLDGSGAAKANPTDTPAELTFKPYATVDFTGI